MSDCQDRPTSIPEALWKALLNLPALRYMKAPVDTVAELYDKYKTGNEKGTFAFVHNENTFYTYHPRGWHRGEWKPISGDSLNTFFEIDIEFLKEDDILVWSESKQKFIVKSGNVWNKITGVLSQVTKFLNQVDDVPIDTDDAGVYFVHNPLLTGLYLVLASKAIKIFNSSDWYTRKAIDEKIDKIYVDMSNLSIRKVYPSYAAMQADKENPKDLNGVIIRDGELVSVVNLSDSSQDGIYRYYIRTDNTRGWELASSVGIIGELQKKLDRVQLVDHLGFNDNLIINQRKITELLDGITRVIESPNQQVTEDGKYLLVLDGETIFTTNVSNVSKTLLTVNAYINSEGATIPSDVYRSTNRLTIPANAKSVTFQSNVSTSTAKGFAFYDNLGNTVSVPVNTELGAFITVDIPEGATTYRVSVSTTIINWFNCFFTLNTSTETIIENRDAISLVEIKGNSITKTVLKKLNDKNLNIIKDSNLVYEDGSYLMVKDGNIENVSSFSRIRESKMTQTGFIDATGQFVTEAVPYKYSQIMNIPLGYTHVHYQAFSSSTRAKAIAFYDEHGLFIEVTPNSTLGKLMTHEIPENAKKYAVSRNTTITPYVGMFFSLDSTEYSNANQISVYDKKGSSLVKTILKNLSNLDLANTNTIPLIGKSYLALKGQYPAFSNNIESIDIGIINIPGFLNRADGSFMSWNASYATSDYIEVEDGLKGISYTALPSTTATPIAYYDIDKRFIISDKNGDTYLPVPSNAKYYRLCRFISLYTYFNKVKYTNKIGSEINTIDGFINRATGILSINTLYKSSDFEVLPENVSTAILNPSSHNSPTASDIAFYNESKTFISANTQGESVITIPANAKYYRASMNLGLIPDLALYSIVFIAKENILTVNNAAIISNNNGFYTATELVPDIRVHRENSILKILEDTATDISVVNSPNAKQYSFDSTTFLERIYMNASLELLDDDDFLVQMGKDYNKIKVNKTNVEIWGINASLGGTELIESIPLGFTLGLGDRLSFGFNKYTDGVDFWMKSNKGNFSKTYLKVDYLRHAIMWGTPFFGVEKGNIRLYNCVLLSPFKPNAKIGIWGDSFIEGATMVEFGLDKRWAAKLANVIGELDTLINGKGGEAINSSFISRFKVENALFNTPYVIVSLGTNNYGNVTAYKSDMQTLIDYIKSNGQTPILVTCTPRVGYDYSVIKSINDWVKGTGELYIDMHRAISKPDSPNEWKDGYVMADEVHPSVAGQNAMFEQIGIDQPFLLNL